MNEVRWLTKCTCIFAHDAGLPSHECPPGMPVHRNGVPWHEAKSHWWWQRCRPQSRGMGVERCSCGAIRMDGFSGWLERTWRWR